MKNLRTLTLLIAFCPLMLNSMENGELADAEVSGSSMLESLPFELQEYIAQYLGNNPQEAVKNIINFSQVNRYFNKLLKKKPDTIRSLIIGRFGEAAIAGAFLAFLGKTDAHQLKRFVDQFMILSEEIPLIDTINPQWIKDLAAYVAANRNSKYQNFFENLITYLIDTRIIDVNKKYHGRTLLRWMIEYANNDLALLILEHYSPEKKVPNTKSGQKYKAWMKKRNTSNDIKKQDSNLFGLRNSHKNAREADARFYRYMRKI